MGIAILYSQISPLSPPLLIARGKYLDYIYVLL